MEEHCLHRNAPLETFEDSRSIMAWKQRRFVDTDDAAP
jgi:hypothetical protein